ncbi:MAG: SCO6880 family protein [Acidimicrobiales bacterium]
MSTDDPTGAPGRIRYRFPPLERRGVIAGWRAGQIGSVAAGLVVAVLAVRSRPSLAGVLVAISVVGAAVALAFWPVAGRTGEQWLPVVVRWAWTGATGRRFQSDPGPGRGIRLATDDEDDHDGGGRLRAAADRSGTVSPSVFDGLRLIQPDDGTADGDGMGVVVDDRARTVTAVLSVRGHSFALLGPGEQDARVAAWARVLASLAREGSAVHRLQWVESCLPDDGRAVRSFAEHHGTLDPLAPAARSYRALLDESAPVTRRHRVLVAVTVHRSRAGRAVRGAGGGMAGAVAVLAREVAAVRRALSGVDLGVDGALSRNGLAGVLAEEFRSAPDARGTTAGTTPPPVGTSPWPMGLQTRWDAVRTDGAWHAVYWISEWPRIDVHPDFLGPLFFAPLRRTLSMVMEPVDPVRAARQVAQARTAGIADGELRRRNGFLTSARHTRERESVDDRDVELADGHAQFRFSGYVGVTADTEAELTAACAELEQAAGHSRIEVRRLFGQQDGALLCVLPLGRGLS